MRSSHSIPVVAIQVNLIDAGGEKSLHFSKVLDTYEEPDDGTGDEGIYDEVFWKKKADWTIAAARALLDVVSDVFDSAEIRFVKTGISHMTL
jgi:hypothetical protein